MSDRVIYSNLHLLRKTSETCLVSELGPATPKNCEDIRFVSDANAPTYVSFGEIVRAAKPGISKEYTVRVVSNSRNWLVY